MGTDGVNSWARQKVGILWGVKNYNQMAIVADISSEKKHESIACQWFNQKEILALLPTVEGRFSMVLSLPIAIGQKLMAEKKDVFNDYLNTITKKRFGNLKLASDLSFVNLSLSTVDSYVGKRIALVGDSAHTIHPLAGLGLNLGIYDLMSLFNHCDWFCDDKVNFDPGDKKKLKDYNSDRLKKVLLVQHSLDFLVDFFGSSGKYVSSFRGFGLNFVDKIPIVKKNLILRARSTF
ncbi:MAG: hypothetical protein CBD16_08965 [Betaproteobacteria bacterium TMED156]|nr:MAG: hypothetical protein CBD16_08965 [Betaproteobacteria bacterium TMED156]